MRCSLALSTSRINADLLLRPWNRRMGPVSFPCSSLNTSTLRLSATYTLPNQQIRPLKPPIPNHPHPPTTAPTTRPLPPQPPPLPRLQTPPHPRLRPNPHPRPLRPPDRPLLALLVRIHTRPPQTRRLARAAGMERAPAQPGRHALLARLVAARGRVRVRHGQDVGGRGEYGGFDARGGVCGCWGEEV